MLPVLSPTAFEALALDYRPGVRATRIERPTKTVSLSDGCEIAYDKLIIATGSSAFVPPIEGRNKAGVFVFRTLDDTRQLIEFAGPGIKAAVIGGGLLGLPKHERDALATAQDTFYEPSGSVHRVARNPSTKTRTRLVAVTLHPRTIKDPTIREERKE